MIDPVEKIRYYRELINVNTSQYLKAESSEDKLILSKQIKEFKRQLSRWTTRREVQLKQNQLNLF